MASAALHETPRLLTPAEVSHELAISRSTLYRLVAAGQLQAVRVGGQLRFERIAVGRFLELHREVATAKAGT